jgi:uncharacterized protein
LVKRLLLAFLFMTTAAFAQTFKVPALTGPVVDGAGILDRATERVLEGGLRKLRDAGGSQINVLTVESLGGLSIEEASIKTTDQWKLGGAKTDNGVLLLVAPNERRVRIEVGQGLEGLLTDAYSNRIVRDVVTPWFKQGDYSSGILNGVAAIVHYTDPTVDTAQLFGASGERDFQPRGTRKVGWGPLIFFMILIFIIFAGGGGGGGRRRRRGMSPWAAGALGYGIGRSGWGGGGGWSGGGGGGGWSGGGGGFSGGGASGGW